MAGDHSTKHILQALGANFVIAVAKGIAAAYTGSGALLAEAIHSVADCCNQLLLLLGVWRSRRPPTPDYPFGFGRALYFWSFMVALLLFCGGGVFSLYEGWHKLQHPEPIGMIGVGFLVLLFSLAVEGYATYSNILEMNARRKDTPFLRYLRTTKDSDLVVVFGENLAATLGLIFALVALGLAWVTGNTSWDAIGTIAIGVVLILVAIFLAWEVKSLLIGERADPRVEEALAEVIPAYPLVDSVINVLTMQQGPGQVILMAKFKFRSEATIDQVSDCIDAVEGEVRKRCPEVCWCFVEPDR